MLDKTLKFFIENYRLNYLLFFLVVILGVYSYMLLPKEVSPVIEPTSVTIRGGYGGTSLETLNKIAVEEIEAEVRNIDGVDTVSSRITPGRFSITLELKDGANKQQIEKDIDDALDSVMRNLPSDMTKPTIRTVAHSRGLMQILVFSKKYSKNELIEYAKKLRLKILNLKYISDVTIFGDSNLYYEVLVDEKKAIAYGLNPKDIVNAISSLSYINPIGSIKNKKKEFFISLSSKEDVVNEFKNTLLNINDKIIPLKKVATIKRRFQDSSTLASMNGKNAITLSVSQNPKGNAITISNEIRRLLKKSKIKNVEYDIRSDHSTIVKERLDIVISNILMAIILITILTTILINLRMAIVISLGIPTSFLLGTIYFYITGYSININLLIGVLIAVGIIVDDAIVISENIQQYIEKGFSPKKAAYLGAKEVAKPVVVASLTTIFAFIPLLMLSGRLGQIMKLIPIAISVLVIASLIESFLFLPIHSAHILNKNTKTLSWGIATSTYSKILNFLIRYRLIFIILFLLLTPYLTYSGLKQLKFKLFEPFDSSTINITFKGSDNMELKDSLRLVQTIEKDLLKLKNRYFIDYISSTAGYRRGIRGAEIYPYVGYIGVYLKKRAPQNFMEKYITPYLSFYYKKDGRERLDSSRKISKKLRIFLRKMKYKKRFHLREINVLESRMGYAKADIMIGISGTNYKRVIKGIQSLESKLKSIDAVKFVGNNMKFGSSDIKLHLNNYGKELGITQNSLGSYLSDLYFERKKGVVVDKNGLLDIKVSSKYKERLKELETLLIPLKKGQKVMLKDICDFKITKSLEKLTKDDGEVTFFVYANIDQKIKTTSEVMKLILPNLKRLQKSGLRYKLGGEFKRKNILKNDMSKAIMVAIILIFLSILYLFNSFTLTLIVVSVIPLSFLGVVAGHLLMHFNLSVPSIVGALGLAGVIVNDGILMLEVIRNVKNINGIAMEAQRRFRPIILTTVTTVVGLFSLIFFASGQAVVFTPLAISLGYGLIWGTVLNLFYVPVIFSFYRFSKKESWYAMAKR